MVKLLPLALTAVAFVVVAAGAWFVGESLPNSQAWVSETVVVPYEAAGVGPACFSISSSAHTDRFCLEYARQAVVSPVWQNALVLTGTFDHGTAGPSVAIALNATYGCLLAGLPYCDPSTVTWTSPDGLGQVVWSAHDLSSTHVGSNTTVQIEVAR